jgi:hypothetical protein
MRGTGQSAFTCAKLHVKARKTLGEAPKTAAEGKSLKLVKELLLIWVLIFAVERDVAALVIGHSSLSMRVMNSSNS